MFTKEEKGLLYNTLEGKIMHLEQAVFKALTEGNTAKATQYNQARTMCIELQMKIHGVEKKNDRVS